MRTAIVGVSVMLGASLVSPAQAHQVGHRTLAYASETWCFEEAAGVIDGADGNGEAHGDLYSQRNKGNASCAQPAARASGNLGQKLLLFFHADGSAQVGLCVESDWTYNESVVSHFGVFTEALAGWCGRGWYAVRALGSTATGNTQRGTGHTDSGWHYFPSRLGIS